VWLQKVQQVNPSDPRIKEAVGMIAIHGSATNTQEVMDMLEKRRLTAVVGDEQRGSSALGGGRANQGAGAGGGGGGGGGAPAAGGSDDLEKLLRRTERAEAAAAAAKAPRSGGAGGGAAAAGVAATPATAEWHEVIAAARSVLRKRPDDALALKCMARALLSTNGDGAEVKSYARRAADRGDEAALGYELHAYLATQQERERDYVAAERHYTAALGTKPGDELAMLGLARVSMQRWDSTAKAKQLCEKVSATNPSCAESHRLLAEIALKAGEHREAYRLYSKATTLAPSDAAALLGLGQACIRLNRNEEAARALDQAITLQPTDATAIQALASVQRKTGRDQDAMVWYTRLMDIRPGDYECSLNLGQLHAAKGASGATQALHYFRGAMQCRPGPKETREILMQMASVQCGIGAWKGAQETLETAARDFPDDAEVWSKLLEVFEKQQDTKGQLRCCRSLVRLNAMTAAKRISYGDLLDGQGQVREARDQFELALRDEPNSTVASLKLANSWRQDSGQDNHLEEARKTYEQVLQTAPNNAEALEGAAYCHRKMSNMDTAIQLYQSCLKVRPTAEAPLYYLGDILYKQHRHAECQHYLTRLIESSCSPDYKTGALYLLAKSRVSLDEYEEAERDVRNGLSDRPNHPHFLFILALVKSRVAEYDASISILRQALQHCDGSEQQGSSEQLRVEIHDWLAQAYERKRDYRAAMAEIDLALQRDPSHVSSLITKGLVHVQQKQIDQGETAFRRALAVEKNHALALVRLGYCRLLSNDHQDATQLFQRALQQRCGTVALPRSVKGTARVYMALSLMGQQDVSGALFQLGEARKNHKNFAEVCSTAKDVIVKGSCEGLVERLRAICDLDVNTAQAWQLVHLLAKELELDLRDPSSGGAGAAPASGGGGVRSAAGGGALARAASEEAATDDRRGLGPRVAPREGADRPGFAPLSLVAGPSASAPARPAKPTGQQGASPASAGASGGDRDGRKWLAAGTSTPGAQGRKGGYPASASPAQQPPAPEAAARRQWAAAPAGPAEAAAPAAGASAQERRQWTQEAPPPAPGAAEPSASSSGALALELHHQVDFGELSLAECLGTGGFGAVYRAVFRGEEVAVKKLFCEDGGRISPLQLEELEKEVAALRSLRHPRLVKFMGACLQPPNLCIVTEYMPGGSLHHLLHKARTPLTLSQQARMALQVSEGVAFLHSLTPPVVHRDLKSLNIVLDLTYNAKICDFGLTQSMEKTHISLKEGGNGGSPRYMAPECYDSKGKITEKVDVWATGCILVEIFGGPLPYDDCTNIQQIMAKILIDKQLPYIPHHLPRGVRAVVEDCFSFDVSKRTTASDVYSRLQQLRLAPAGE